MSTLAILAIIAAVSIAGHAALFVYQRRHGVAAIIDVAWTLEVGIGALVLLYFGTGAWQLRVVLAVLISVWMLRLASHIIRRLWHEGREDTRYTMLKERWGAAATRMMFGFYVLQSLFVLLFLAPFVVLAHMPWPPPAVWVFALTLVIGGALVTFLADRQLAAWKRDPASHGRTCRRGVWAWSRHPNYFGEWLWWTGISLLALGHPQGAWLLLFPLIVLLLLTKVTGIPYAEAAALRSRGEDYRRYQAEVSAFWPLPPRSTSKEFSDAVDH